MQADVADLLGDTHLSVPVTYRAFGGTTFTPSTGAATRTFTNTTLRAIRNAIPTREVVASDGLYRQGDLRFILQRAALPTEPTKDDHLVDGAKTYDVIDWDSDPISVLWRIVAREVA